MVRVATAELPSPVFISRFWLVVWHGDSLVGNLGTLSGFGLTSEHACGPPLCDQHGLTGASSSSNRARDGEQLPPSQPL